MFFSPWPRKAACRSGVTQGGTNRVAALDEGSRIGQGNASGGGNKKNERLHFEDSVVIGTWIDVLFETAGAS